MPVRIPSDPPGCVITFSTTFNVCRVSPSHVRMPRGEDETAVRIPRLSVVHSLGQHIDRCITGAVMKYWEKVF